jgi:PleD family two-component response regulator
VTQTPALIYFSPSARPASLSIREFVDNTGYQLVELTDSDAVLARVSRAYPPALIIDASEPTQAGMALCRRMKDEAFTAVVPLIMFVDDGEAAAAALEAGADEVLTPFVSKRESDLRLELVLRRAERDVSVHPTTRLPGTVQIERDMAERIRSDEKFAVCYADLDHFKEFNDRYGYHHGDGVILLLSIILRDVVRAYSPGAFVGHIGGDDFIFSLPLDDQRVCCETVLEVFDELIPYQYSEQDRELGSFVGKDRRGQAYEVPLMTLSIGVVTNEHRWLTHTAQISELATEMKAYAKTFPGSVFVVDRRTGDGDNPPNASS